MSQEPAYHGHRMIPWSLSPMLHKMETQGLVLPRTQVLEGRSGHTYFVIASTRRAPNRTIVQLRKLADEVPGECAS